MHGVRTRRWDLLLMWGFLVSFALVRAGRVAERDPYWQIRAGAENLAGVPLARPDSWTWSGIGGDWYPNSPLWNVGLAAAYQAGGFWGFFALSAAVLLLVLAVSAVLAAKLGARPLPGLAALFLVFAGALPYLGARATLGAQALILLAVLAGVRLSDLAAAVSPAALAGATAAVALALSVVGNWIHLSFLVVGPGLAVVWALIWSLTPALGGRVRAVVIAAGALGWALGPLLSPYGLVGGWQRARAVQDACQGLLTEWSSPFAPSQDDSARLMVVVAILMSAGAVWWLRAQWRRGEDVRLLAALTLVGVPASLAGLVALRFLGIGPVTLAPVAAAVVTSLVDRVRRALRRRAAAGALWARLHDYSTGRFWRLVLGVVLVLLLPVVGVIAAEHGVPPERAITARLPTGCRVFSSPAISGAVVLLRPDAPVWMDGRADFFGRERLLSAIHYYQGNGPDVVPAGTGCVLVDRSDSLTTGLRQDLATSQEWRLDATEADVELWLPRPTGSR